MIEKIFEINQTAIQECINKSQSEIISCINSQSAFLYPKIIGLAIAVVLLLLIGMTVGKHKKLIEYKSFLWILLPFLILIAWVIFIEILGVHYIFLS